MYPVTLIRISKGKKIEVEMKNDDIITGKLIICDLYMNMRIKNAVLTTRDSTTNFKECFIKGSLVKCIKLNKKLLKIQEKLVSKNSLDICEP